MAHTKWIVDAAHSDVQFKIKHLVISTVTGAFNEFEGNVETDGDNFEGANVHFEIKTESVDTKQKDRDAHLRSSEFFDTAQFPKIIFDSTSFSKAGSDEYTLEGELEMHGVRKPVKLQVEYGGVGQDGYGNTKAGFEVTGKVNRKEFGLTYNALTETGGLTLGEDIKLIINIQLLKQA